MSNDNKPVKTPSPAPQTPPSRPNPLPPSGPGQTLKKSEEPRRPALPQKKGK